MAQPVYIVFDGANVTLLPSSGDTYLCTTDGVARSIAGLDGSGYQDGTEVKFMNNGPDTVTLLDNSGAVGAGDKFFLPSATDRTLGANGKPYWMVRNANGPRGDGWYDGEDPP